MPSEGHTYLNYWLPSDAKSAVKLEILDSGGKLVRELKGSKNKGITRLAWDLRYSPPEEVQLRTTPEVNPEIWSESRFREKKFRPVLHWGIGRLTGPMVAPGEYTARLTIDGHSYTQWIEVLADPHSSVDAVSLARSVDLQLQIRDDINQVSRMVNKLEWMRKQLEDVVEMLQSEKKNDDVDGASASEAESDTKPKVVKDEKGGANQELMKAALAMDENVLKVEQKFISKELTYSDGKYYVEPFRLYYDLIWLNAEIGPGAGDVAGGTGFAATDTEFEMFKVLDHQLEEAVAAYKTLTTKEAPAFNEVLMLHGIMPTTTPVNENAN
jgi:hypothetical protein